MSLNQTSLDPPLVKLAPCIFEFELSFSLNQFCFKIFFLYFCVRVCVCLCVRLALGVFFDCFPHYLLRQGLSLNLEKTSPRQQAPGIFKFSLPLSWDYRQVLLCLTFYGSVFKHGCSESVFMSSCLRKKHFTESTPSHIIL